MARTSYIHLVDKSAGQLAQSFADEVLNVDSFDVDVGAVSNVLDDVRVYASAFGADLDSNAQQVFVDVNGVPRVVRVSERHQVGTVGQYLYDGTLQFLGQILGLLSVSWRYLRINRPKILGMPVIWIWRTLATVDS